ncbi:MAG TPA: BMP family ABC transporter substrate-binding protein, partial [Gaiellaceae bacterium]|nr:BMP family ABC transporter substrate-binding protein [Gaiellaceae bacterium]
MRKRRLALALPLVLAAALVLALGVSTGSAKQQAAYKAAWIYVGPHDDHGWSQAHDQGRLYVQKQLGSKVVTTYKENVPEGPQVSQVIDSLVRDGNKIIFATSFGFGDAMFAAAKKYPDVKFEHATGYKSAKNFATYFGAGEDAIYLSGMAAGAATKTGVIGYVVPFPIP